MQNYKDFIKENAVKGALKFYIKNKEHYPSYGTGDHYDDGPRAKADHYDAAVTVGSHNLKTKGIKGAEKITKTALDIAGIEKPNELNVARRRRKDKVEYQNRRDRSRREMMKKILGSDEDKKEQQ